MKRLNKKQNLVLLIGIIIFVISNIFPPWIAVTDPPDYLIQEAIGYSFIFSPPQSPLGYESYVVINYSRLFIEWGILVFLMVVTMAIVRKKR